MIFLLTLGTDAPKNYLCLLNNKSMVGRWFQARRVANSAIHIGSKATIAADDVMMIVSHSCLVTCGMTGWLNAAYEPSLLQDVQVIVDCLGGEGAKLLACNIGYGFRIPVLTLANYGI